MSQFYATVEEVFVNNGTVRVDINRIDQHNSKRKTAYVKRNATGMTVIPQKGWIADVSEDSRGRLVVNGFVSGPEAIDSDAVDNGFQQSALPTNQQFKQAGGLPAGSMYIQTDRGTGIIFDTNTNKLELHSLNDLTIRASGTIDMQEQVPEPGERDLTAGNHTGGTPMKILTQQEYDDMQTRLDDLEQSSVNTRTGRNINRSDRNIDYLSREGNFDSPAVQAITTAETVDAVTDLGWDDTGGTPISIGTDTQSDRTIEVPAGTYLVDQNVNKSVNNFQIVGKTGNRGDVTFTTGDGTRGYQMDLDGEGIRMAHFTSDLGPFEDDSGLCFNLQGPDHIYYENIEHIGFTPDEDKTTDFRKADWAITDQNGLGVMDTYINTGPGHIAGHKDGAGIALPASAHEGTMYVKNTDIRNDNGDAPMYVAGQGYVVFENCTHVNNAMAQFRMGGNSVMRGCTAVVDVANQHPDNTGSYADSGDLSGTGSVSGLYWAGQQFKNRGGRVEGCVFQYIDRGSANGKPISVDESQVDSLIVDTDIQCDESPNTVIGSANNDYNPATPHNIDHKNLTVVGTGSPNSVFDFDSSYHDNCLLEGGCIDISAGTIFGGSASWDKQDYTTSGCSINDDQTVTL